MERRCFNHSSLLQVEESLHAGVLGDVAASSQAPYPSPCRKRQGSLAPPLLLSPAKPLRWVLPGAPELGDKEKKKPLLSERLFCSH